VQVRLNYREPGITECEPAAPDNLTEREPKSSIFGTPDVGSWERIRKLSLLPQVRAPQKRITSDYGKPCKVDLKCSLRSQSGNTAGALFILRGEVGLALRNTVPAARTLSNRSG
jgi:hypothetical protein